MSETVSLNTKPASTSAMTYWVATLAVGILIGFGCFIFQFTQGLGTTGLSNTITWGLYIVAFMFLVGISAGGLIVVAGAELAGTQRFESINRLAIVLSVAAVATAAGTILPDLGRPQMAWKMMIQPHFTSPLVWDMAVLTLYLAIGLIDLWIITRVPISHKALRVMAIVSLPIAILVHSITAWIFGLLVARPFWNTPLLAPLFITSALVSGTALVIATAYVVERTTAFTIEKNIYQGLRHLLLWFVSADAFLLFTEVMTTFVSGEPDHRDQLEILLTGKLAWVFWPEVILGVLIPVILLLSRLGQHRITLAISSGLLLLGVLAKRINILFAAEFQPLIGLAPGIPSGRSGQSFTPDAIYFPSWVELGVLLGMASFFFAIVTIGVHLAVLPFAATNTEQ